MKSFLKFSLIGLTALILIGTVSVFFLARSTGSKVSASRAKIQAAGDKVVYTEYATQPIPDEDNAYYYLMQLGPYSKGFEQALLTAQDSTGVEDFIPVGRESDPVYLKAMEKSIADAEEGFRLVEQAGNAKQFRSKINHTLGYGVILDHIGLFRSAGRMLQARAVVLASQGMGDEALRDCITGLKLQQVVDAEPMVIQYLVALSVQTLMYDAAHHVLVSTPTSPEVRAELDAVLASVDNRAGLVASLKAERAIGLLTFDQLREGSIEDIADTPIPNALSSSWVGEAYLNDDEAAYTRIMNQMIELVGKPRPVRKEVEDSLTAELSEKGFRKVVTKLTIPAIIQLAAAQESADTQLRCLRMHLKLQDVSDPDLESFPDSIRIDPIARKPLVVKKQAGGWLIYGVGDNEKDDGGDFSDDPTSRRPLESWLRAEAIARGRRIDVPPSALGRLGVCLESHGGPSAVLFIQSMAVDWSSESPVAEKEQ